MNSLVNYNGEQFLNYLEGKSGVYFISNEYHATGRFLVKVGMAQSVIDFDRQVRIGGLNTRLSQYLLYYPRGYTIFGLYTTNYDKSYEVEKLVQSYLAGKGRKSGFPHSHSEEWFILSHKEINDVIRLFSNAPNVRDSVLFMPPYMLRTNPTLSGRRRLIKEMSTPMRRVTEETIAVDEDVELLDTLKKKRKANDKDEDVTKTLKSENLIKKLFTK